MYHQLLGALILCLHIATKGISQQNNTAPVVPNAPTNRPLVLIGTKEGAKLKAFEKIIAPAVKEAQKTLPQAKQRFLLGLPSDEAFFLTTRIYDTDGSFEQVFIRVTNWESTTVIGTIANELRAVQQYHPNQSIEFPEKDILDWTITKSDGSEEGNFVGRFIDILQQVKAQQPLLFRDVL